MLCSVLSKWLVQATPCAEGWEGTGGGAWTKVGCSSMGCQATGGWHGNNAADSSRESRHVSGCEELTWSASLATSRAQAISAAPPPYTIRLSFTRFRMTHRAS